MKKEISSHTQGVTKTSPKYILRNAEKDSVEEEGNAEASILRFAVPFLMDALVVCSVLFYFVCFYRILFLTYSF